MDASTDEANEKTTATTTQTSAATTNIAVVDSSTATNAETHDNAETKEHDDVKDEHASEDVVDAEAKSDASLSKNQSAATPKDNKKGDAVKTARRSPKKTTKATKHIKTKVVKKATTTKKRKEVTTKDDKNAGKSKRTNKKAKTEDKDNKKTRGKKTTKKDGKGEPLSEKAKNSPKKKNLAATKKDEATTKQTKGTKTTKKRKTSKKDATAAGAPKRKRRKKGDVSAEVETETLAPVEPPPPPPPPKKPRVDPFPIAKNLLTEVEFALLGVQNDMDTARELLEQHHPPTIMANQQKQQQQQQGSGNPINTGGSSLDNPIVGAKSGTAGHSNTNHQVVVTGDLMVDRLLEYQRNYAQRQRVLLPEGKGSDRWDKPRLPGQRRRRIHREADRPEAPPEPPPVGYTVFVGQMTTKIRHDRPDQHHSQPRVMQEIAKMWKEDMTDTDRQYYIDFATAAKAEYVQQQMEFRATSTYTKSTTFLRLGDHGPWIKNDAAERNSLEKEVSTYDTVEFPLRPACMDEEYAWRDWRSKINRKLKLRKLIADYNDTQEQLIVAQAIDHAKATLMDAAGLSLSEVDHSAILSAATHECIVKLKELKEANRMASSAPPPAEADDVGEKEDADAEVFTDAEE
ncbi:expressed unknown protein [Seminavis robusta]|uniref:HMG box domain-containing protein n=1 Tax=Seminavis robusta TaxID=568900 RepID=A0A9N8DY93_9STRA|nr:expressed unknown protein [Seminavis robusta]|eukprot:Sro386_g131930.1 n/a (628) ;mRNA; r:46682-48565